MAIDLSSLPDPVDLSKLPDQGSAQSKGPDLSNLPDKTEGPKTGDLGDEFQKPIPALQKIQEGVKSKLSEYASKVSPTDTDVAVEMQKTGKIPYLKMIEDMAMKTRISSVGAMIPTTPMEIAMSGFSGLAKGALQGEVMPEAGAMSGIKDPVKPPTVDTTAELVVPKEEQMADEAIRKGVARDAMKPLEESAIKTPEKQAIAEDTENSLAVRKSGVPPALVDSSNKLKGTIDTPALKPEVIPDTRAWAWDVYNRLAIGAVDALQKQGQSGFSLANDVRFVRDVPQVQFGMEFAAPFEQMHNLIPDEMKENVGMALADALEGKGVPPEAKTPGDIVPRSETPSGVVPSQMLDFTKQALSQIADRADSLGLKIHRADGSVVPFAERENYFPRMIKTNLVEKLVSDDTTLQAQIARHMVDTKQSTHFSAAMEQVKLFRKNLLDRKFGNLERAREIDLPKEFYERNAFKVIPKYMRTAYQRLAEVRTFGLNDAKALMKIDGVAMEGKDADLALRTYRRFTGRDPIDGVAKGLLQGLRSFSAGAMIHFQTTLYHIPRMVYPAFEAGYLRAAEAFFNSFGEASDLEARRMGVNLSQAMGEFLGEDYGSGQGMTGKFANATATIEGLKPLDRFGRKFAAILGKDWIQDDLIKTLLETPGNKRVREQFMGFGVDPDLVIKNKGLSDLELNTMAKRFSDRIEGAPDSTTLPLWQSSPAGKMYFQFRNFTKVITGEMQAIISRAARTKDMATLARLVAGWYGAGTAVHLARKALGNKDVPYVEDPEMNYQLNSIRDGVPLPISVDLMLKALQGKKGIMDFLVPPSVSNVADLVGDVGSTIRHGDITKRTERDLLRHTPVIGTTISHRVDSN